MKTTLTNCLLGLGFVLSVGTATAEERVLHYEPVVVQLSGTVKIENHYGPPGFGATPKTDRVLAVAILVLDSPVNVVGNPPDPRSRLQLDSTSFRAVTRMQMVFETPGTNTRALDGEPVTVRGMLFQKVSGENFTDVLVNVQSVSIGQSRAR